MKKLISIISAVGLITVSSFAATKTVTVPPNFCTNILAGSSRITLLSINAATNSTITIYDSPSTVLTNVVGGYTNYTQYATNIPQIYTNFFGVPTTNWLTNVLVTVTNATGAQTFTYNTVFNQTVASNQTATLPNLNVQFLYGVTISNASTLSTPVTIGYQK